jgi:hypothetical protein
MRAASFWAADGGGWGSRRQDSGVGNASWTSSPAQPHPVCPHLPLAEAADSGWRSRPLFAGASIRSSRRGPNSRRVSGVRRITEALHAARHNETHLRTGEHKAFVQNHRVAPVHTAPRFPDGDRPELKSKW